MSRDRYSPYEFALVVAVAFGWSILGSVSALLSGRTVGQVGAADSFTSTHLYAVVLVELIALPVIATILYLRGWRLKDFPLSITTKATIIGLVVFVFVWLGELVMNAVSTALFDSLRPELERLATYKPSSPPDLIAISVLVLVNPLFEEVIVCGYVIPVLSARFGQTTAINVSVIIRGLYHLYQGVAMLPFHLLYGLIQAYLFVRLRQLWPLIVSHAALDFMALLYHAD